MHTSIDTAGAPRRSSLAVLAVALAAVSAVGCAVVTPSPSDEHRSAEILRQPDGAAEAGETPSESTAAVAEPQAAPRGGPARGSTDSEPTSDVAPQPEIVVLYSGADAGAADIAARIVTGLSRGDAANAPALANRGPSVHAAGQRLRARRADIRAELASSAQAGSPGTAVAVGLDAFEFARRHWAGRPIVFCQIYHYEALLDTGADGPLVRGVSPMPPLALQLRGWKGVDASLRRIGLIVSDGHERLVEEAARAAAANRVELMALVSGSDRETLYLFKRLAPELDGLWLFPDNRILSPAVLEELLAYAVSHGVGVLVHNESLLTWGALLSAASRPDDVAAAVAEVAARVAAGRTRELPAVTALSEAEFKFNADAAGRLGIASGPERAWVLREPD